MQSRPWYLSVTAIWSYANSGYEGMKAEFDKYLNRIPFSHKVVPESFRHFTVLPLIRITKWPVEETGEDIALNYLSEFRNIMEACEKQFNKIMVKPLEVKSYDSGTTIQFESVDNSVSLLREEMKNIFNELIVNIANDNPNIYSEIEHENAKNTGNITYGSISRSYSNEGHALRWRMPIPNDQIIEFNKVFLLASDQFLSNPAAHNEKDRLEITLV